MDEQVLRGVNILNKSPFLARVQEEMRIRVFVFRKVRYKLKNVSVLDKSIH